MAMTSRPRWSVRPTVAARRAPEHPLLVRGSREHPAVGHSLLGRRARHGVAFLLCFTYPLVTTFVIKMQNCMPATDASKAVVYVLSGNTLVECYTGNHAHPYLLSSAVGIFHVIAFPDLFEDHR